MTSASHACKHFVGVDVCTYTRRRRESSPGSNDFPCRERACTRNLFPAARNRGNKRESSHLGDLRGRSTCQAGNGPIDQTTAVLKVWRRATVKRPTGPAWKTATKKKKHIAIGLTTHERVRASCSACTWERIRVYPKRGVQHEKYGEYTHSSSGFRITFLAPICLVDAFLE